jgi:serine protease Do
MKITKNLLATHGERIFWGCHRLIQTKINFSGGNGMKQKLSGPVKQTGGITVAFGVAFLLGSLFDVSLGQILGTKGSRHEVHAELRLPTSFAELAEAAKPSVVNISTTRLVSRGRERIMPPFSREWFGRGPGGQSKQDPSRRFFFGEDFWGQFFERDFPQRDLRERSLWSGFVIDSEGHILTNNHVVQGADDIKVKFENGKELKAKIVGRDAKTDIALIRVSPAPNLPPARLGDSDRLKVGEWVVAIGNPFGLNQTVTAGIVSAKDRVIGSGPYDDFIQTDASINPGNSGGPLFNTQGEVVGVSTAILSRSGGNIGIGFAIPINTAKRIAEQLKNDGKVKRGWLGLAVQPVTEEIAGALSQPSGKGALVADVVPNGPGDRFGIKRGDIIVEFDGTEVKDSRDLSHLAAKAGPGKSVKVKAIRDGSPRTFTIRTGEYPDDDQFSFKSEPEKSGFGLSFQDLNPDLARRYGLEAGVQGVVVTSVEPESHAATAGIREGDLVLEVNGQKVNRAHDARQQLSKTSKGKPVLFLLKRDGQTLFAGVKVG